MGTLMASLQRLSKDIESLHVASDVNIDGEHSLRQAVITLTDNIH